MSAYLVEDKLINQVIAFIATTEDRSTILAECGVDIATQAGAADFGKALFALNCNAIEQRYGKGEAAAFRSLDYAFRPEMPPSAIQAYKRLGCFLYQCSEGDVPETSLLFAALQRISDNMAHAIVQSLPAYDKAGWSI